MAAGAVVGSQAVLGACGRTATPRGPISAARSEQGRDAASDANPLVDYARALFAERDTRLSPAFNLFLAQEQAKPRAFAPFRDKRKPPSRVHSARMIAFGYGERVCDEHVVEKDGTICEGAVYPGKPLTQEQTARAAELFRTAVTPVSAAPEAAWDARPVIRCFDPHHSIVFFDEHSTPIGEMTVCFECGNFRLAPGPADEAAMTDAEGLFVADTCRALDVGGCPPAGTFRMPDRLPMLPEHASRASLTGWEQQDLQRSLALAAPHGVKEAVRLADLTSTDRKVLCSWFAGARHATGGGLECKDGRQLMLEDYDACVKPVPKKCDATAGDFVACTRARLGTLCGVDAPECARTDGCHKGVVLTHW